MADPPPARPLDDDPNVLGGVVVGEPAKNDDPSPPGRLGPAVQANLATAATTLTFTGAALGAVKAGTAGAAFVLGGGVAAGSAFFTSLKFSWPLMTEAYHRWRQERSADAGPGPWYLKLCQDHSDALRKIEIDESELPVQDLQKYLEACLELITSYRYSPEAAAATGVQQGDLALV